MARGIIRGSSLLPEEGGRQARHKIRLPRSPHKQLLGQSLNYNPFWYEVLASVFSCSTHRHFGFPLLIFSKGGEENTLVARGVLTVRDIEAL